MTSLLYKIGIGVAIIAAAYFYVSSTQSKISDLSKDVQKYKTAHESCELTLKTFKENITEQENNIRLLGNHLVNAESYNDFLRSKLGSHNLTYLALEKPGLIERRINDATKKVFADISNTTAN